ncbi:hypothetical protein FSP39_024957 [Pinctada imbricata]|uniref:Hexosyltransferase n=1 Tax=Pinctada imbricata TaxID=66713 RepID=A0AA89C9E2_PINIB|nr:hypothetical protein FSP39_024957 [Pinctada imbricata]
MFSLMISVRLQTNQAPLDLEQVLFQQLIQSYKVLMDTFDTELNKELETYICHEIFSDMLSDLEVYGRENGISWARRRLSFSNLKSTRSKIIRKISEETVTAYPLNLDVKNLTLQKIRKITSNEEQINKLSIKYVFNPSTLCSDNDTYLLVLIKSNVRHHHLRYTLRKTWVKEVYSTIPKAKVAFLLGYSFRERLLVWSENRTYGDIIQGDFIDAYRNNTYKTVMSYKWAAEQCSGARFVFSVDDDMFVNVKLTKQFLNSINETIESDLFSGMIVPLGRPAREEQSPWYISKKDYPYLIYPQYLAGCAMFLSQNVVQKINMIFPYVKYLPFDDVLLGIVANKLGIRLHSNEFLNNVHINNVTLLHKMIANHGFRDDEFLRKTYYTFTSSIHLDTL